jgi:hypothetical protein
MALARSMLPIIFSVNLLALLVVHQPESGMAAPVPMLSLTKGFILFFMRIIAS